MTYHELLSCAEFLGQFHSISSISRVEDNTLKIDFEPKTTIYASLKRGNSGLFMSDDFRRGREYRAPFDIILNRRFSSSQIESLKVSPNDRVLIIKTAQKKSYKLTRSTLQLEFTGKNTNAIILDEDDRVEEALRHVSREISYRAVKVGEKLEALPKYAVNSAPKPIENVEAFLRGAYEKMQTDTLQNLKNAKFQALDKKIAKLNELLNALQSEEELQNEAKAANEKAILLCANRHLIDEKEREFELEDFEGKKHLIKCENIGFQASIDELFARSKRLKQRAKSVHIERENLLEKIAFAASMKSAISNALSKEEIEILLPKRQKESKNSDQDGSIVSFFIEGYKVMVGKNAAANAKLLKIAKKNDIWFHVKDVPSSHVILKTDKTNVSQSVINFCAKLCLNFSPVGAGAHEVDYTPRRNVKVIEGSNVNYVDFKSVKLLKE